jgi:hypothetical protein
MIAHYSHIRLEAKRAAMDAIAEPVSERHIAQNWDTVAGHLSCPAPRTRDRADTPHRPRNFLFFIFLADPQDERERKFVVGFREEGLLGT